MIPEERNDSLSVIYNHEDSILRLTFGNETVEKCNNILRLIKANHIDSLAGLMPYPIDYECASSITNKREFIAAYRAYFDSLSLAFKTNEVRVDETNLYYLSGHIYFLGFILCGNGEIGTFYQPTNDCIAALRKKQLEDSLYLYKRLQAYERNLVSCYCDSYLIRVDVLSQNLNQSRLRLCLWAQRKSISTKPEKEVYLTVQSVNFGSLDLWHYSFKHGGITYEIERRSPCGEDNGEQIWLSVKSKDDIEQNYKCTKGGY